VRGFYHPQEIPVAASVTNESEHDSRIKVFIPKEYFKHAGYLKTATDTASSI
jgi:hypothetical protein